jgi:transcriptional regulator with XRE-family HTH domain
MDTSVQRRVDVRAADQLGWVLSEIRGVRGATQQATADAVGMDRTQLAHLEAGRSGRYLANLLDLLGHLGASLVVEWNVPVDASKAAQSDETVTNPKTASLLPRTSEQIQTAGVRSGTHRLSNDAAGQSEAMRRALAPTLAMIEALNPAIDVTATAESSDAETP